MNYEIFNNNFVINGIVINLDDFGYVCKNELSANEFLRYSFNDEVARKYHINYLEYEQIVEKFEGIFNRFVEI